MYGHADLEFLFEELRAEMNTRPTPLGKGTILTIEITRYDDGYTTVDEKHFLNWDDVMRRAVEIIQEFRNSLDSQSASGR